jgi:hypothetical protein
MTDPEPDFYMIKIRVADKTPELCGPNRLASMRLRSAFRKCRVARLDRAGFMSKRFKSSEEADVALASSPLAGDSDFEVAAMFMI